MIAHQNVLDLDAYRARRNTHMSDSDRALETLSRLLLDELDQFDEEVVTSALCVMGARRVNELREHYGDDYHDLYIVGLLELMQRVMRTGS
jgi:hypothetical protein